MSSSPIKKLFDQHGHEREMVCFASYSHSEVLNLLERKRQLLQQNRSCHVEEVGKRATKEYKLWFTPKAKKEMAVR